MYQMNADKNRGVDKVKSVEKTPCAVAFKHYSFAYPASDEAVLKELDVDIFRGSFTVVCGFTGSGKTTFLRAIKPELTPVGDITGSVEIAGRPTGDFRPFESASHVGFVMQNPDNQMVMDTVWHELAFGLENLGIPTGQLRRRVAETAHFFGIGAWFEKKTSELSGGQKQILNLASVVAMQPDILVLDEPTSQLDPIASRDFLHILHRVNTELGITVIMSEHHLEEVLPLADRILFLQEGRLIVDASPQVFIAKMVSLRSDYVDTLPAATKVACLFGGDGPYPVSVREGRAWLAARVADGLMNDSRSASPQADSSQLNSPRSNISQTNVSRPDKPLLTARDLWFRYGKQDDFVLRGATLQIDAGKIHALVGGNGSGKSTLLFALAGVHKPAQGYLKKMNKLQRVAVLAQDAKTLFVHDTLYEDLCEGCKHFDYAIQDVEDILARLGLTFLKERHPYDLSGGEMQKAALAKLLLLDPDILLLDEPVKGVDTVAKKEIAAILREERSRGKGVLLVSHDLDFVAEVADTCSMMFGGGITCSDEGKDFFEKNLFFTTGINRVTRDILNACVTLSDVACRVEDAEAHA